MKDLHMHTVFSDGKNTPEEMVQEAIRLGLDTVGISDHSHLDPCGMTLEASSEYRKEIAGLKVTAVRDYQKGVRTENGREEPTGLPTSNVLYFELENGNWVCVRPSGTEPKIKLYVNSNAADQESAEALNAKLCEASKALLA